MLLLIDEQATSREVTRALRSFLTKPASEDLVLIYLACHGGPDPRRPNGPLYLLTHDTELGDIAGTAVPMDEIHGALNNSLLSERVVVIADTCHSGGLGARGRRAANSAEATNSYLSRLAESKAGVALLTSCEASESSQEDERWGGGHGVFTWHLLEGMRGAADGFGSPRDGIVAVGELVEYVREQVRADTDGSQHPSVGSPSFDRELPMAVTGDLDVERHLTLARNLVELGWLTDDPAAFICAVQEAQIVDELAALSGRRLAASGVIQAEALLATGRAQAAADALGSDLEDDEEPHLNLVRGIALAESGQRVDAAAVLSRFAVDHPEDLEAQWAADYASAIGQGTRGIQHALLIGAGTLEGLNMTLPGARNDALELAQLLVNRIGFRRGNVQTLTDKNATRRKILNSLGELAANVGPEDTLVVSFSGHATGTNPDDLYLVTHDAGEGGALAGISSREFADGLARITCATLLLILDTGLNPAFKARLVAQPEWTAFVPSGQALDTTIDGTPHGAMTKALVESWPDDPAVTYGELADRARKWLREHDFKLTPTVIGQRAAAVVITRFLCGPALVPGSRPLRNSYSGEGKRGRGWTCRVWALCLGAGAPGPHEEGAVVGAGIARQGSPDLRATASASRGRPRPRIGSGGTYQRCPGRVGGLPSAAGDAGRKPLGGQGGGE